MALRNIPLPQGFKAVEGQPRQRERLFNYFFSNGLLTRPGITSLGTGQGRCRASFVFNGTLYHVSGSSLVRVHESGFTEVVGYIPGLTDVAVAVDFAEVALVVKGGRAFTFDGNTISETVTNYVPSVDVTVVDGIFVYIPEDGSPAFYRFATQEIDPLFFFDAESVPDVNKGVENFRNDLLIFGEDSIEVFRHTGPDTAPFVRVLGGVIPVGYLGGKVQYRIGEHTVAFVGRDKDGGVGIFTPEGRISSDPIDEILQRYSEADLKLARGNRFAWLGNDIIVFSFPRNTFAFNGEWFELGSGVDENPWDVQWITRAYGRDIVGMADSKIGYLSDVDTDFGVKFERFVQTFVRSGRNTDFTLSSLEIDAVSRRAAGSLGLRVSRDGFVFGQTFWRDVPPAGQYRNRVQFNYPGGLGCFESFAGIRLRTTEAVDLTTDALWVDDGN